jgi:hypothetical protein
VPEQDLTTKFKSEGAEKVVADLGRVDKGQEAVQETTKAGTKATEQATEQQVQLNAAEGDYVQLLTQISPTMGRAADALLKFAKIAGEGDRASRSLTQGLAKMEAAAQANKGLIKLVGAASAAGLAIWALVAAYKKLTEERERANKALEAENKALEESRKQHRDEAAAIREIADTRRNMPFASPDESAAAARQAMRLVEQLPGLKPEEAHRLTAGYLGVDVKWEDMLEMAAALMREQAQVIPEEWKGAEARGVWAQQMVGDETIRKAARAGRIEAAERDRARAQAIRRQAPAGAGEELEAAVASLIEDPETRKRILGYYEAAGGSLAGVEEQKTEEGFPLGRDLWAGRGEGVSLRPIDQRQGLSRAILGESTIRMSTGDYELLLSVARNLEQIKNNTASIQRAGTIINNGEDAASADKRSTRGTNMRENVEHQ